MPGLDTVLICACARCLQLTPLSGLGSLQQLDVSGNQVSSLQALSLLKSIKHLSCERNFITTLTGVSGLSSLVELYAANNCISDIKVRFGRPAVAAWLVCRPHIPAQPPDNHMHTCNLLLLDHTVRHCLLQEAERGLSALPCLVVLDLYGNPLAAATEGCRLLLLFKLPCLKVLDGRPADAAELAAAREQHAGRLTISALVSGANSHQATCRCRAYARATC